MDGDSGIRNPNSGATQTWPDDESLIPDWIYTDPGIYDRELEKIFLGRHWNYVGLECEVPEPGNYFRSYVGPLPVVVTRDIDGKVHVFENRCAHRGVEFCREYRGSPTALSAPIITGPTISKAT